MIVAESGRKQEELYLRFNINTMIVLQSVIFQTDGGSQDGHAVSGRCGQGGHNYVLLKCPQTQSTFSSASQMGLGQKYFTCVT